MDVNTPAVVDGLEPPPETAEPGEPGLPDTRVCMGEWMCVCVGERVWMSPARVTYSRTCVIEGWGGMGGGG